eukprot:6138896-Prymnesium_polylepis.3
MLEPSEHANLVANLLSRIDHAHSQEGGLRLRSDTMDHITEGCIHSIANGGGRRELGLDSERQR